MDKKRILVVDDEMSIVNILKVNLEKGGYDVLTAMDGEEGLITALTEDVDLVPEARRSIRSWVLSSGRTTM